MDGRPRDAAGGGAMKRANLPLTALLIGAVAIFLTGFGLALLVSSRQSAAATIRCTLGLLVLFPIGLLGGVVMLKQWWERYQKRQRLQEEMQRAEIYQRLQGSVPRSSQSRQRRRQQEQEHGDTIQIVLPGDRANQRISDRANQRFSDRANQRISDRRWR